MTVFEHLILPARNRVDWLDGSSGNDGAERSRVNETLDLQIDPAADTDANPRPREVVIRNGRGGFVFWHDGRGRIAPGPERPDAAAFAQGAYPAMDIHGSVTDPSGRFLPRRFALAVDAVPSPVPVPPAQRLTVAVYRSPASTLFGRGGGLYGQLCWDGDRPASWARIQLSVGGEVPWVYDAQADARGEFRISLFRLPAQVELVPLPRATLRVFARNDVEPHTPIIVENQPAARVGTALTIAYAGVAAHPAPAPAVGQAPAFDLVPGRVGRLRSAGSSHIAIAPA